MEIVAQDEYEQTITTPSALKELMDNEYIDIFITDSQGKPKITITSNMDDYDEDKTWYWVSDGKKTTEYFPEEIAQEDLDLIVFAKIMKLAGYDMSRIWVNPNYSI